MLSNVIIDQRREQCWEWRCWLGLFYGFIVLSVLSINYITVYQCVHIPTSFVNVQTFKLFSKRPINWILYPGTRVLCSIFWQIDQRHPFSLTNPHTIKQHPPPLSFPSTRSCHVPCFMSSSSISAALAAFAPSSPSLATVTANAFL